MRSVNLQTNHGQTKLGNAGIVVSERSSMYGRVKKIEPRRQGVKQAKRRFIYYVFIVLTDLTKSDSDLTTDLTKNSKQHHCKSRTCFLLIDIQFACSDIQNIRGMGRVELNFHKQYIPQFFELLQLLG